MVPNTHRSGFPIRHIVVILTTWQYWPIDNIVILTLRIVHNLLLWNHLHLASSIILPVYVSGLDELCAAGVVHYYVAGYHKHYHIISCLVQTTDLDLCTLTVTSSCKHHNILGVHVKSNFRSIYHQTNVFQEWCIVSNVSTSSKQYAAYI